MDHPFNLSGCVSPAHFNYHNILSTNQWEMLRAMAKESKLRNPNAKAFIQKYGLGAASSASRALKALQDKDMVGHHLDDLGGYHRVNDVFFEKWLQRT